MGMTVRDTTMLYLSQMMGKPVVDIQGEKIGTISDLAISTGEVFPTSASAICNLTKFCWRATC